MKKYHSCWFLAWYGSKYKYMKWNYRRLEASLEDDRCRITIQSRGRIEQSGEILRGGARLSQGTRTPTRSCGRIDGRNPKEWDAQVILFVPIQNSNHETSFWCLLIPHVENVVWTIHDRAFVINRIIMSMIEFNWTRLKREHTLNIDRMECLSPHAPFLYLIWFLS